MYYVYIIKSLKDDSYYIGHTSDLNKRITEHNRGKSKYTKVKKPWHIIYSETFDTRKDAMQRELEIKKRKSRTYIEKLIKNSK